MQRGRWLVGLVLCWCAGCSHAATPAATPGSSSPASTSPVQVQVPAPTPTGAPVPVAARAHTDAGAAAFLRFYFDRLNAAFMSPATQAPAAQVLPSCQSCRSFAENVGRLRRDNQRAAAAPYALHDLERPVQASSRGTVFELTLLHNATTFLDPAGRPLRTDPREIVLVDVGMSWHNKGWALSGIHLVPVGTTR